MTISMESIRAKLIASRERGPTNNTPKQSSGDNASYPFWNIEEGQTATIRLLPDGNPDNAFFWAVRKTIKLPFAGVIGGDYPTNKAVTVTVPSMEMWGEKCPITEAIRPWWKTDKDLARVYWRKQSYLFQGFVTNSPFVEASVPENPIRRFVINQSVFEIIEKSLMDAEMEDLPIDLKLGRDFKITKTRKGDYANYGTSSWSMKTRAISDKEQAAIDQYGLFNLSDFLGTKPTDEALEAIKEMFDASVNGLPFNYDLWGQYYRPYGVREEGEPAQSRTIPQELPASPAPTTVKVESTTKMDPQDILARIRNRTSK